MSFISDKPIQLIQYSTDKTWAVNEEAIPILSKLKKPIKVLAIAGRYRSGKSHILNKFLSVQRGGFELGHSVQGCTKGIWVWGKDTGKEILLALDTEGLNDLDNDPTFDSKLFSLTLLLSSYVVLNIPSVLDEQVLQNLSFVTKLSKIIFAEKTEEKEDDGTSYKELFPPVMFLIRDFMLGLPEGQTLDDYLANALKQRPGRNDAMREKNDIRDSITQCLPARDIMAIPPPHVEQEVIQNIQDHEDILSKGFKKAVDEVCSALHKKVKPKQAKYNGGMVDIKDGEAYLALTKAIVEGLNTNGKIEIPSMFEAVCEMERRKNVTLGSELLSTSFDKITKDLPLNETELTSRLESAQKKVFVEISEKTLDHEMQAQVTDELNELSTQMKENIFAKNKEESRSLCKELKTGLVEDLRKRCASKSFKTVEEFTQQKQEGIKVLQDKGIGPALGEVLTEFENDCAHLSEALYTQLQLKTFEIEAAESARKHAENQRQIEQLKKESEEASKQSKIREEALKAQNEAFAKKLDDDMRRWREEKDEMQKQFKREIEQARKIGDTKLLDIAEQQYQAYSCKRDKRQKEAGGEMIYVRPYVKKNGTKVDGYWRRK